EPVPPNYPENSTRRVDSWAPGMISQPGRYRLSLAWSGGIQSSTARVKGPAIPREGLLDHRGPGVGEKLGTESAGLSVKQDLGLREFRKPHRPVSWAVAAGLATAEGCRRVGRRSDSLVHSHHSRLKPPCDLPCGASVFSPDTCTQGIVAGTRREYS